MSVDGSLVVGAQPNSLASTIKKVSTIHGKSGPFDCCLLLGDVCSKQDETLDQVLNGSVPVPLPCYFTMGSQPLPENVIEKAEQSHGEVASNLIFLGESNSISASVRSTPPIWPAITTREVNMDARMVASLSFLVKAFGTRGPRSSWFLTLQGNEAADLRLLPVPLLEEGSKRTF